MFVFVHVCVCPCVHVCLCVYVCDALSLIRVTCMNMGTMLLTRVRAIQQGYSTAENGTLSLLPSIIPHQGGVGSNEFIQSHEEMMMGIVVCW